MREYVATAAGLNIMGRGLRHWDVSVDFAPSGGSERALRNPAPFRHFRPATLNPRPPP